MESSYICMLALRMRTVKVFLAIIAFSASHLAEAQFKGFKGKPIEFGFTIGASNYIGELSKPVALQETHPMGGLICRFNFNEFFTIRGTAVFGRISGKDANYSSDAYRNRRNLSFRSDLVEFSGTIEYNILGYQETQRYNPATPYLFAGLGVFKYNPLAKFIYHPEADLANDPSGATPVHPAILKQFDGQWIELQPLGTEGQETTKYNDRKRYALTQLCIPFGVGYKKQFNDVWAWGTELGIRKTFTDYLDDVSKDYVDEQIVGGNNGFLAAALKDRAAEKGYKKFDNGDPRGSAGSDWYFFLNFTITRKITGGKQVCFQF